MNDPSLIVLLNGTTFLAYLKGSDEFGIQVQQPVVIQIQPTGEGQIRLLAGGLHGMERGHEKLESTIITLTPAAIAYIIPPNKVANDFVALYRKHITGLEVAVAVPKDALK